MWFQLLILGIVIGANNFATSLALGALGQEVRRWRIITVFAVFEFCVPLLGVWLGRQAAAYVAGHTDWLGPTLLAGLGLWTLFEATRDTLEREALARRVTSWQGLVILSAGLSIDNLVVGFGLGLGHMPALLLAGTIMTFSVLFSWVGLNIGGRAQRRYETASEILAGLLLIALAWANWMNWI